MLPLLARRRGGRVGTHDRQGGTAQPMKPTRTGQALRPGAAGGDNNHSGERDRVLLAELLPFERAAIITYAVIRDGQISRSQAAQITGLSNSGATKMICRLARILPIYYDPKTHNWHICH